MSRIHEVYAYLRVADGARAIDYYREVFGAKEKFRLVEPGSAGDKAAGQSEQKPPLLQRFQSIVFVYRVGQHRYRIVSGARISSGS